jgi:hypothetical protein
MFDRLFKAKRKTVAKGDLKNLNVEFVSLLFDDMKPANQKGFVAKSTRGTHNLIGSSTKWKSDDEGRIYVTVYEPGVKDSQGDSMTAEEIQKACDLFSQKGMVGKNDVNHNLQAVDEVFIAENSILKAADPEHYPDTKVGAWVQTIKFDTSKPLWLKAKSGNFNGVSLYGEALDLGDSTDYETIKSELTSLKTILEKSGNSEAVKEIDARLKELESNQDSSELKDFIAATRSLTESVNKAVNTVIAKGIQDEPTTPYSEDVTIKVGREDVVVKGEFKELYKSIGAINEPKKLGILNANEQSQFIDAVIDMKDDDTFSDVSMIPMGKDEKIDKGIIEDIILKNKEDGAITAQDIPDGEIECPSQILFGALALERDTVEFYEQKYGEEAFGAYVNQKIIKGIRKQLRILLFAGDRASGTASLKSINGIIKVLYPNVTTIDQNFAWEKRLETALLSFSNDVLEEREGMVIYVSPKDLIRIRAAANVKVNNQQGRLIVDNKNVYFDDIPIKQRRMTDNHFVIGLSKFIIIGLRTDVEMIKQFKDDWKWYWNFRLRAGITVVGGGFVKSFKVATV